MLYCVPRSTGGGGLMKCQPYEGWLIPIRRERDGPARQSVGVNRPVNISGNVVRPPQNKPACSRIPFDRTATPVARAATAAPPGGRSAGRAGSRAWGCGDEAPAASTGRTRAGAGAGAGGGSAAGVVAARPTTAGKSPSRPVLARRGKGTVTAAAGSSSGRGRGGRQHDEKS